MENPWVLAVMSWFLPGSGHIIQGKVGRGLVIGGAIWAMYIIGVWSGGAYYPGFSFKDGFLLHILNIFATFGNGVGFFIDLFLKGSSPPKVAAWATFEYGGRLVEVAGLLNYLAAIDAFDTKARRNQ